MRISDRGISLIKQFEGLRLTSYQDSVGIWTIGYGPALSLSALSFPAIRAFADWVDELF